MSPWTAKNNYAKFCKLCKIKVIEHPDALPLEVKQDCSADESDLDSDETPQDNEDKSPSIKKRAAVDNMQYTTKNAVS